MIVEHRHHDGSPQIIGRHYFHRYEPSSPVPPLEVIASGSSRWFYPQEFERNTTGFWGIELVTLGSGYFVQDGTEHALHPGMAFILRRGSANRYGVARGGFLHKRYLQLRGMVADQLVRGCGLAGLDTIRIPDLRATTKLFRRIHGLFAVKSTGWEGIASALAYELLYSLGTAARRPVPEAIRRLAEHVDRNIDKPLTGTDLAAFCGASVTHCSRLTTKHLGYSPKQYIINQKMALASHLLRESVAPVKEICTKVGYEDPLYFSAQFRKWAGMSPRAFRRKREEEE